MAHSTSMKDSDSVLRARFMEWGFPYFAYRYGEKTRGITRIGKWTKERTYFDREKAKNVTHTDRFNVTPKKMLKVVKTFSRGQLGWVELHLWLDPLPEAEQMEWRSAFQDLDVIYDKEVRAS